jgi:hypothetical protein
MATLKLPTSLFKNAPPKELCLVIHLQSLLCLGDSNLKLLESEFTKTAAL